MNRTQIADKPIKAKKCRICRQEFRPFRSIQPTCGAHSCEYAYAISVTEKAAAKRQKEERKAIKARKEKIKTRSDYIKEAQVAFNSFIRERDKDQPCICCGKPLGGDSVGGAFDCGHYRSVGSAPHLRFDPCNAHGQRKQCNRYGAGRAVDYRIGLIGRIGLAAVEALESDNEPAKWSVADLKSIKEAYRAKLKALRAGK